MTIRTKKGWLVTGSAEFKRSSGLTRRPLSAAALAVALAITLFAVLASAPRVLGAASFSIINNDGQFFADEQVLLLACSPDAGNDGLSSSRPLISSRCLPSTWQPLAQQPWQGCTLATLDLANSSCTSVELRATHDDWQGNLSVDKDQALRFLDTLLAAQQPDGGWQTPLRTAQAIYAFSLVNDSYKKSQDAGMEWLKQQRQGSQKCWGDPCDLRTNARILLYLGLAGYNDTGRVIRDGMIWLNDHQNYIADSAWTAHIIADYNTSCTLYQGTQSTDVVLPDEWLSIVDVTASQGMNITLSCTDSKRLILYDSANHLVIEDNSTTGNITYTVSPPCWGYQSWRSCDLEATLLAAMNPLLDSDRKDAAVGYLKEKLRVGSIVGKYLEMGNALENNALFILRVEDNDDILDWLLYQQNNDGSWGTGLPAERIQQTATMLEALEKAGGAKTTEPIHDARTWIEDTRPKSGWSNLDQDILTYQALASTFIPYALARPPTLELTTADSQALLLRKGPWSYQNISAYVDSGIADAVKILISGNLSVNSTNITLVKTTENDGRYEGIITIQGDGKNISAIAVSLVNLPTIQFSAPEEIIMFGNQTNITFHVRKSSMEFSCMSSIPYLTPQDFHITNEQSMRMILTLEDDEVGERSLDGDFFCTSSLGSVTSPFSLRFRRYKARPFRISQSLLKLPVDGRTPFVVINLLETPLSLELNLEQQDRFVQVEDSYLDLPPNGRATGFLLSSFPDANMSDTYDNTLVVRMLSFEERANVRMQPASSIRGWAIKIAVFALIIVGILIILRMMRKRKGTTGGKGAKAGQHPRSGKDASRGPAKAGATASAKPHKKAERDMLKIAQALNRAMNKDDGALTKKLQEKGLDGVQVPADQPPPEAASADKKGTSTEKTEQKKEEKK
ncbi:hypothetical protein AUJ68_00210 [Candidatus Woesearchaeota archaeon CG1_02_57_44]|nr:MAG: hypothetical protein AUJ68_00210 [Candidatus Woesearchaeota archaeon CG1_02_57_44]